HGGASRSPVALVALDEKERADEEPHSKRLEALAIAVRAVAREGVVDHPAHSCGLVIGGLVARRAASSLSASNTLASTTFFNKVWNIRMPRRCPMKKPTKPLKMANANDISK